MSSKKKTMFGGRFLPSEHQSMLEAAVELGIEEVRQSGDSYELLFWKLKEKMEMHGSFPDREPEVWKKFYLQAEENYRAGKLHPPEARILWGTGHHPQKDYSSNDIRWKKILETTTIFEDKNSKNFIKRRDTRFLIQEAIVMNVEGTPKENQMDLFYEICDNMHQKQMFNDLTSGQLYRYYLKIKQLYLKGSLKYLTPHAKSLWVRPNVDLQDLKAYYKIRTLKEEDEVQIYETDDEQVDLTCEEGETECRICQSSMVQGAENLLDCAVFGKTYKDLLEETIDIKIGSEINSNLDICPMCSTSIKNLSKFVRQCRESFKQLTDNIPPEKPVQVKVEPEEMDESVTEDSNVFTEELVSDVKIEETIIKQEIFEEPSLQLEMPQTSCQEMKQCSKPPEVFKKLPTKKMKCEACERVSLVRKTLDDEQEERFQCDSCGRKCGSSYQLTAHKNIHTRKSKWTCRFCHRIFYHWKSHKEHEQAHLDKINNVEHNCFECGIVYSI